MPVIDRSPTCVCRRLGGVAAGVLLATALGGMAQARDPEPVPGVSTGAAAYQGFPAPTNNAPSDYKIGPLDVLSVTVFKEPDLSFKEIQVDAGGNLLFPLIGDVHAAGKSANDVSKELAARLNEKYLRNAQVSVVIVSSVSQHVTVEGSVVQPGVYDISGNATLLQAIALAKSPTRTARLDQVAVFRFVEGKRMGAVFDLRKIRNGEAPDPALRGGDIVVVGFSKSKGIFRDFLQTAPLLGIFAFF